MDATKLLALSVFFTSFSVMGQNLQDQYYTTRPKGMGSAYVSIANDKNTIWYNPAGVTRLRKARSRRRLHLVTIPNMQATANQNGFDYLSSVFGSDNESMAEIISDNSSEFTSENIFANLGLFPYAAFELGKKSNVVMALGGVTQGRITSIVSSPDYTSAATSTLFDIGGLATLGWATRTNLFSIALQLRPTQRYNYEDVLSDSIMVDPSALGERIESYSNSTFGFGLDFGMIYTFADIWFPTLAVSMYNIPIGCKKNYLNPFSATRQSVCGTVYSGDVKNPDATGLVDPTNLMVGMSMTPRITRKLAMRVALELHHINLEVGDQNWGLTDVSWQRKVHGGLEFFVGNPLLPPKFSVTAGYNQGFYTAGLNMNLGFLALAASTYAEDVSTNSTPREDRKFSVDLSLEF